MPEYPHLYEVEPSLVEPIRPERPYDYYGHLMVKGSFGDGVSYGEMSISTNYDINDPYDQRIQTIKADIMAMHQFPDMDPREYLMLEFEIAVIEAERNIQSEIEELSDDETFVDWFTQRLDEVIPIDAPMDDMDIRRTEAKVLAEYILQANPEEDHGAVVEDLLSEINAQRRALKQIKDLKDVGLLATAVEVIEPILDVVEHSRVLQAVA